MAKQREMIASGALSQTDQRRLPESHAPQSCDTIQRGTLMAYSNAERNLIFAFRMLMAWTFIYAASHQAFVADFTVVGFLNHTKTFHGLFTVFTTPALAPIVSFMVAWGHLLIGLSLLVGLMVRVSSVFGIALLLMYWMAHMDWPFIENNNNFIVDYHIVYATVMVYLFVKHAGHVWGLDGAGRSSPSCVQHPVLRPWSRKAGNPLVALKIPPPKPLAGSYAANSPSEGCFPGQSPIHNN